MPSRDVRLVFTRIIGPVMNKRKTPHPKKRKPVAKQAPRKRHSLAPRGAVQTQFEFGSDGVYYDLQAIFDRLNKRYFRNRLRHYTIKWARKRSRKPARYIVFGCIQEEDREIRINRLLDRDFVPWWYVEYVVFHEMLHAIVPDEFDGSGRRRIHHERFLARERRYRNFKAATAWETENLGRFLR